jgi:hypothetical protein
MLRDVRKRRRHGGRRTDTFRETSLYDLIHDATLTEQRDEKVSENIGKVHSRVGSVGDKERLLFRAQ